MKYLSTLIVLVLFVGCAETKNSEWQSDPEYRAYIATRLADAIIEYNVITDEIVEEGCDGSGWIIQGDGHKTECPGCDACKSAGDMPEIEWSTDTLLDIPQILEEFKIPIEEESEPEPEVVVEPEPIQEIIVEEKPAVQTNQDRSRGLFRRRR